LISLVPGAEQSKTKVDAQKRVVKKVTLKLGRGLPHSKVTIAEPPARGNYVIYLHTHSFVA
jgi:hypothetical protein